MDIERITLLAYLAGIIDGEGYLGFYSRGKGKTPRLSLEVKMTDKPTIDLLHQTFGGPIMHRPAQKEGWKDQWRWRVTDNKARAVYKELLPYLRIKIIREDQVNRSE